jgi:diguanylate cyclase (GGDEF)-like protein/PAS domain S-box-containing protein
LITLRPSGKSTVALVRALSILAVVVALLTLCEYLFRRDFGIDQAIFRDSLSPTFPGRMGLNTAVAIALLGAATMAISDDSESVIYRGQFLAVLAAIIPLFSLIGYIFSARIFYQMVSSTPMAIHTAVVLFGLCGAVLWTKPDLGLMTAMHADDSRGLMLRRMIPAAIVTPIVLGWVRLEGQRAGLYDTTFGLALLVTAMIFIFGLLIVMNARGISRSETAREQAYTDLRSAYSSVERHVVERTQELSEALSSLAQVRHRFELATNASDSGILDLDITTEEVLCSRRWCEMLGRSETGGQPSVAEFVGLIHPDDRDRGMQALFKHFKGESADFSAELRMLHADGSYRWMLSRGMAVRDASGKAIRMIGTQTDITEIKRLQEALRNESIKDDLSGLYNRKHFVERLSSAVQAASRHDRPLSLCMCDLEGLKQINDRFGHQAGDSVIMALGKAITAEIRNEDVAARYGGDEFCIMLPETKAEFAASCLERIRGRVEGMLFFTPDNRRYSVTASFGVSDLAGRSVPQLMEAADAALYEAKRQGGNRVIVDESIIASA